LNNDPELYNLKSIILGEYALNGDDSTDRKMIQEVPYYYKNSLELNGGVK